MIALLAIKGDAGTDDAKISKWLAGAEKNLLVEMTQGWGDHGWFAEGDGPSGVAADTSLIPAFQAMRVAGGKDFFAPRPNVPWMTMKWVMLTQLTPKYGKGRDLIPLHSGTYDHNVYARTGLSGAGYFAQGFGAILPEQKPALLWLYNRMFKAADDAAGKPFDTVSAYPHRAVLAFVNWPFGMAEKNPGEILAHAVEDKSAAHYMFRNRWQDADDIIVDMLLKGSRGHCDVKPGQIFVWGLGKKTTFPVRVTGAPTYFSARANGVVVSTGTGSFGVDFSRASGADALLVLSGPITGAPKGATVVTAGTNTFTIMTVQKGAPPEATANGDKVSVGGQTISILGGNIAFEK